MKITLTKRQRHAIAKKRHDDALKCARFRSQHRIRLSYWRPPRLKRTLLIDFS